RVALYLADHLPRLLPRSTGEAVEKGSREAALLEVLADGGAAFFGPLHEAVGGGYPAETVEALWTLVWRGPRTHPPCPAPRAGPRARTGPDAKRAARRSRRRRSDRGVWLRRPRKGDGCWSSVRRKPSPSATRRNGPRR